MGDLHLRPDQLDQVLAILRRHLAPDVQVHAFGSRASGLGLKPHSDLDLLLDGPAPLPTSVLGDLNDAFSESDLPFRVDLLQRHDASADFLALTFRAGTVALPTSTVAP